MSEEKKAAELKSEELEQVSGGDDGFDKENTCACYIDGVCAFSGGESNCPYSKVNGKHPCETKSMSSDAGLQLKLAVN